MAIEARPGFYGKLPVLGDFVFRRLPREFIEPWDQWLQSAIAASREQLGQDWLNSYLNGPLWRFALTDGIVGSSGWMGVLMPSVDRVGRYFPLTLAVTVPNSVGLPALFTANGAWYSDVEAVALTALEDNLDADELDRLLGQIGSPLFEQANTAPVTHAPVTGKNAVSINTDEAGDPEKQLSDLNTALVQCFMTGQVSMSGQTVWGTLGTERIGPFVLICQGLPPVHAFAGLITGDLPDRGWTLVKNTLICRPEQDADSPVNTDSAVNAGPWLSYARTDIGRRRKCNEDAVLNRPEAGLWAVADGMGGHQAGDVASTMIVEALAELKLSGHLDESVRQVRQCLRKVNEDLRDLAEIRFNSQIVGSTIVVMLGNGGQAAYLWAGDSRLYHLRAGRLMQLTADHSGDEPQDAPVQPALEKVLKQCNVITRAVGADDELLLDSGTIDVFQGDKFLLCSDGLDKEVAFAEIETILNANDCKAGVDALIELALDRNARDNVSIVVVEALSLAS